jgi:hypothetical protein
MGVEQELKMTEEIILTDRDWERPFLSEKDKNSSLNLKVTMKLSFKGEMNVQN